MRRKNSNHPEHSPLPWLILLAIACIAAAELAASYFFAPEFFHKVADPVQRGAQAVSEFVVDAAHQVGSTVSATAHRLSTAVEEKWEEWEEQKAQEALLAAQEALEPAILPQLPIADPAITELESTGGRDYLTGGTRIVEYFQQSSPVWADQPYGTDDLGRYGCGPTAMAMAVSTMTDTEIDPEEMAEWAVKNGHWARGGGSYLSLVQGAAEAFGLTAVPVEGRTPEALEDVLLSDGLLVALMGPGHFTNGGHFILIRGVTLEGTVLVADPNSLEHSLMEWDPQLLLDELSSNHNNGGPLWALYNQIS